MRVRSVVAVLLSVLVLGYAADGVDAQTTAFSYQGSLADGGGMADGMYDFEFTLFDALSGGTSVGADEHLGVQVLDGLFSVELDFGSVPFDLGNDRWLEVSVRVEGAGSYTALDPRTMLGAVPYATHAEIAEVAAFALTGPFAPVDTTPGSTSGFANQTLSYVLTIGGQDISHATPIFPISVTREVIINQAGPNSFFIQGGDFRETQVDVVASYDPANLWEHHFDMAVAPISLLITADTIGLNSPTTEYEFVNGTASGYRLAYDPARGLVEILSLSFPTVPGKGGPQINDIISRTSTGITNGFPSAPSLGGASAPGGILSYSYAAVTFDHSNVGQLPSGFRQFSQGFPTNNVAASPVTMLYNAFVGPNSTLWNLFADSFPPARPIQLNDSNGLVWPINSAPKDSIISGWSIEMADDGGLFEIYTFEHLP